MYIKHIYIIISACESNSSSTFPTPHPCYPLPQTHKHTYIVIAYVNIYKEISTIEQFVLKILWYKAMLNNSCATVN